MKLSYNWLQSYFDKPLPSPEKLESLMTMQLCEIEGIEKIGDDTMIDAKELPDRSCYLLGHKFYAEELFALFGIVPKSSSIENVVEDSEAGGRLPKISVGDTEACRRYIGRVVTNVSAKESPQWLKDRLTTIGQRPINLIVDITNYVMFDLGQPMHAFDLDKVKGNITVRYAKDGEKITTLDGRNIDLTTDILIIADDEGPLGIAGVKGGKRAEVDSNTKNIILEAANFNSTIVRKMAQKVGIRNDSSKRFENSVTPERAEIAMNLYSKILSLELPEAKFSSISDIYPNPAKARQVKINPEKIRSLLGVDISDSEIVKILTSCGLTPDSSWNIIVPPHRLDINDDADVSEEVGRIYGYDKLPESPLPTVAKVEVNKTFSIANKIRAFLQSKGFSEVYTHTLVSDSKEVLANPLNSERGTLRDNLSVGLAENIALNIRHKDYLGLKEVKVFEIGHVFEPTEHISLAFGIGIAKNETLQNQKSNLEILVKEIMSDLNVNDYEDLITTGDFVCEIDLEKLINKITEIDQEILVTTKNQTEYEPLSPFPYSIRDVAVFVPGEATEAGIVLKVITENAGEYLHKTFLFDVFTKKANADKPADQDASSTKTSYGYRMIFQAKDKTLSEEEISTAVQSVNKALANKNGWEVR